MQRRRRRRRGALALALAGLAYMIFGGNQGLVKLLLSWREARALKSEIAELRLSNAQMEQKAQALARDRAFYEKTAREKLMLKQPGEMVYRFDRN